MKNDKGLLMYGDFSVGTDTAPLGHNRPPSPFDEIASRINELYDEAKNFLDGEPISTQGQADAVTALLDMIRKAAAEAEAERVKENKPFDEGKAAVQEKYAPLIADTKKVRGKAHLAADACKKALTPWREKVAAEKAREAELARQAAEAARAEAEAKRRAAAETDLAAQEEARRATEQAMKAERVANSQTRKANTGNGMRTTWMATMTDEGEALCWAWEDAAAKAAVKEAIQSAANEAVRNGARKIPGFTITEERKAV